MNRLIINQPDRKQHGQVRACMIRHIAARRRRNNTAMVIGALLATVLSAAVTSQVIDHSPQSIAVEAGQYAARNK